MPPRKRRRVRQETEADTFRESEEKSEPKVKGEKSKKASEDQPTKQFSRWIMKSEPESRIVKGVDVKFSVEDLKSSPDQTTSWDGVRNYQARNFMRDQMKIGDLAFFYHSNCKEPGIVGVMEVVKESYVDDTQFDQNDPHYDWKSSEQNPKWVMVDVKFVRMTERFISLVELRKLHLEHKASGGLLKSLSLFTQPRLSVSPLTKEEFDFITSLERI